MSDAVSSSSFASSSFSVHELLSITRSDVDTPANQQRPTSLCRDAWGKYPAPRRRGGSAQPLFQLGSGVLQHQHHIFTKRPARIIRRSVSRQRAAAQKLPEVVKRLLAGGFAGGEACSPSVLQPDFITSPLGLTPQLSRSHWQDSHSSTGEGPATDDEWHGDAFATATSCHLFCHGSFPHSQHSLHDWSSLN